MMVNAFKMLLVSEVSKGCVFVKECFISMYFIYYTYVGVFSL